MSTGGYLRTSGNGIKMQNSLSSLIVPPPRRSKQNRTAFSISACCHIQPRHDARQVMSRNPGSSVGKTRAVEEAEMDTAEEKRLAKEAKQRSFERSFAGPSVGKAGVSHVCFAELR